MFTSHIQNLTFSVEEIKRCHATRQPIRINDCSEIVGAEPWHTIAKTVRSTPGESLDSFIARVAMELTADDRREIFCFLSDDQMLRLSFLTRTDLYISRGRIIKESRDIEAVFTPMENENVDQYRERVFEKVRPY